MKKFLAAVLILSAAALTFGRQAAQQADEWVKFTSPEGRFSILMPVEPQKDTKTASDPRVGAFTTNLFMARSGGEIYIAGWVDYDPKFNFDRQSELEANRDNLIKGVKATLKTTNKFNFNNDPAYPGIEFTAESPQLFIKSRVFIIGRRPYQIIAVVPPGGGDSPNIGKFLSSFEVKPAAR